MKKNYRNYRSKKLPKSTEKMVHKIVKKELKDDEEEKQFQVGGNSIAFYGALAGITFSPLCIPAQNITDSTRVGDAIKLRNVTLKIGLYNGTGGGANTSNFARIVIFQFNQDVVSGTPLASNMFINGGGAAAINVFSSRNHDFLHIYHVLYDKTVRLVGGVGATTSVSSQYTQFLTIKVPLKYAKKKIQYTGASVFAINQLYLCVLGDQGSVAVNPTYTYDCVTKYSDA